MMSCYDLLEYHRDFPFLLISHEEITHALLQYDSCEFGSSDRSYRNNSILFDPTSDEDVKWLLQPGECRLASLSFRQNEYTRRVINVEKIVASGHRITSRLEQFPPEDSRMSPMEHLLQAQLCYAAFIGEYDRMQSLRPCCGNHYREYVHYAAAGGHVGIIRKLLQEGCPLDDTNSQGHSLLHIAALFGRNEVAVELIERGANLESGDQCTALHYAALNGHIEIIREILRGGCPIDINDKIGITPLFYATANGRTEAVIELIANDAAKDLSVEEIGTPLHLAAESGHLETVRALLNEGCNVLAIDGSGCTAIHLAARKGHVGIIRELLRRDCPTDLYDTFGSTPLFYASANGHTEAVVELIANGAAKNISVREFGTPLHLAARVGHFGTVKALLNEGCNVLAVDDCGCCALHRASEGGHVDIIRELLRRDCPIDARDQCESTPLHYAAACGQTEAVVELIKNGGDKDAVARLGGTPLHEAAINGHLATAKVLLDEGCSVSAVDSDGCTALLRAACNGHLNIVAELLKQKCDIDKKDKSGLTALHYAAANGHTEVVVELFENGAIMSLSNRQFTDTPLHMAARNGHLDVTRELLRRNCPINSGGRYGFTPLYWAAEKGQTEVVEELIKNGARIHMHIANPRLGSPLHLAAKNGHLETVRLLLRKGCLPNAQDRYGKTAIYHAIRRAHLGVVQTKVALELWLSGAFVYFVNVEKLRDLIIRGGHCDMLEAILTCEKPTVLQHRNHVINVGLCKAIAWDQEELAAKLIDEGSCRHFDNLYNGRTPLHYAAHHGKTEIAVRLIRKGATKDIVAGTFGTALHLATLSGYIETFKALVENGCSLKSVDVRGYTVLHFAVLSGRMNWELLKGILMEQRWLIDKPDKEKKWTPLHVAARHGKTSAAVELIRWGAEKDPISNNGHNPLHLAGVHGHVDTFTQLLEEGCSMHSLGYSFLISLEKQPGVTKDAILTALLERGYDLDMSQVSLFTWPFAVAKRRSLEEFQAAFDIQEKHTWIQQYHKALDNHGYVRVNVIRCVFVGPPKVGKSCLKHLLVHNQSKEIEHSTPVMESPAVVTFNREMYLASAQSSTSAWEYVSEEGMGAILRGWTENVEYHSADSYPRSTVAVVKDTLLASPQPPQSNQIESMVHFYDEEVHENVVNDSIPDVDKSIHTHTKSNIVKLKIAHCHLVSQVKEYKNTGGDENSAHYTTFINLIDSGGQPTFMDTLPLLLGTPCTYIHVFNASKDVDSLAEITYRDTDGRENVVAGTETTWELMLRSFSSVHTLEYKCSEHLKDVMEDSMPVPPCRIAVVGTFKDELLKSPNHEEVVAELNLRLKVFSEHAHSSQPLMRDEESDQYLFLVDNLMYKNGEHQMKDSQYVNSFRNALSSEDAALKLKIPLMWLMMELVTRKSGVKYIPYRDLKTFSLKYGYIDDNEHADDQFRALLMLFHNLGFYAYYELEGVERENNLVCTEATALFKEISKLLLIHFITPKSLAAKHFQEKGEILLKEEGYKDLFSEIGVDSNIDSEWFLNVIYHLGLSAKLSSPLVAAEESNTYSYFIPIALPCGRANLPVKSTVAKLCFSLKHWKGLSRTYRLPRVIFPRLIVILVNDWNNWHLQHFNSDRTTVKFVHEGSFICVSERATLIEVNLLVPKCFFPEHGSIFKPTEADVKRLHILCDSIRGDLTGAIETACTATLGDSFTKSANVVCGSLCSLCGAEVPHVATPSVGPGKALMCPEKIKPFSMTSEQLIWFSDIDHSTVQVSLIEGIDSFEAFWVLEPLNSASTEWGSPVTRQQIDPHKLDLDSKPCESDLLQLVGDGYNPKWKEFGIRMGLSGNTCEGISQQKSCDPEAWLALLCSKWLSYEAGTRDKPCTWRTVLSALRKCGFPGVAADQEPADQILRPPDINSKPYEADLLEFVGDHIDSKWQNFGIELGICKNLCEGIKQQKLCIPKECFILLCSKWLSSEAGTGDKPRTWRTVLDAVRECGFFEVADQVEQSFSKNPVLSSKPDLKDLADLIGGELGSKWSQLGHPLSIDESIVAVIQASGDVDCFVDMMRMWLDRREGSGSCSRTWDTVLSGLDQIGFGNLAGQVERHLVAKSSHC